MAGRKSSASRKGGKVKAEPAKRNYFKQSDFPLMSLQQAQKIASGIVDNFAGVDGSPPDVALSLGISPTSSAWPSLCGASIAYGLTDGGHNANKMKLTSLGRKLVAPEAEGEDIVARRESILKPRLLREFFEKYRRAKFPNDTIGQNVLKAMQLPNDRLESALEILKANGKYAGIIRETPTGLFVNMDSPGVPSPTATVPSSDRDPADPGNADHDDSENRSAASAVTHEVSTTKANRVFISHGKQKAIVGQIKELLTFGNFEPVVSVERESTAIPVPEKVFEDMRSCGAGVIHVGAEGKYLDKDGNELTKMNDNVLIEIGAAMALYGKRVILLVERGLTLPSNLQGLYRCDFEGDKLEYESTMKLLKTFSQFR
jgi:predicted nucleotide-binding protein